MLRGGVGIFTGRFLLVPAHIELQQNGFTGRIIQQRLNGAVDRRPRTLARSRTIPSTTGIALPRDAGRDCRFPFVNPTRNAGDRRLHRCVSARTGLFADFEGIYVKGDDEIIIRDVNWRGNADAVAVRTRRSTRSTATRNEGRSTYKAFVASVNGTIKGGHIVTASLHGRRARRTSTTTSVRR